MGCDSCFLLAFLSDAYHGGFTLCDLILDLYLLVMLIAFDASTTIFLIFVILAFLLPWTRDLSALDACDAFLFTLYLLSSPLYFFEGLFSGKWIQLLNGPMIFPPVSSIDH